MPPFSSSPGASHCPLHSLVAHLRSPLLQKCPFSEVEVFLFFWSSSSWKSKSHSVRCSFCAEGRDQSWCQTAVRKRCCSAPMKNPWWDCSPGRNRRPARRTGSRAELFHYAALRAGRSLCTGPCEASRELSQMFLSEKDERKSQTNVWPTSGRVR